MDAKEILTQCEQKGIRIRVNGQNLKCGPKGLLSEAMLARIKEHKPELIQLCRDRDMQARARFKAFQDEHGFDAAERLAIMTVDGGLSDDEAMGLILGQVAVH